MKEGSRKPQRETLKRTSCELWKKRRGNEFEDSEEEKTQIHEPHDTRRRRKGTDGREMQEREGRGTSMPERQKEKITSERKT